MERTNNIPQFLVKFIELMEGLRINKRKSRCFSLKFAQLEF